MKHLSLDLWGCLITPNKEYGAKRNDYLTNLVRKPETYVRNIYSFAKKFNDELAETHGINKTTPQCWHVLMKGLLADPQQFDYKIIDKLVQDHPPFLDPKIVKELKRIRKKGITLNLSSNTNFISGETMRKILKPVPFDFLIFSDELTWAKPHTKFFNKVIELSKCDPKDITHVGDNKLTDGGCLNVGIPFEHVANPTETLKFLKTL